MEEFPRIPEARFATEKSQPGVFLFSGLSSSRECSPRAAVPWLLLCPPSAMARQLFVPCCWSTTDAGGKTSVLLRMSQGGVGSCVKCEMVKELGIHAEHPPPHNAALPGRHSLAIAMVFLSVSFPSNPFFFP